MQAPVTAPYACALEVNILDQGKLYVTDEYILFHSNLFGTKVHIPLGEIISIEKEKTLIFNNAISITTTSDMYMFRSFLARDDCYAFMESNLQKYRSATMVRRDSI
mmetsp:Transcript_14257/g.14897  ORF Transcript_14257/g.14897 Transcript_14257/m.14897 type:complete len:106 (-) Transcript_14257:447-764(-)